MTTSGAPEPAVFLVRQDAFEGTLGELAWALRSGTVAPGAIDLLALVQSYLEHFDELSAASLDWASAALPHVARVIELKLRLLLPRPPREPEDEEEEILEETLEAVALLEELEDAIDFLRRRRDERRIVLPARTERPSYPRPERPIRAGVAQLAQMASRYGGDGYFELTSDRLTMGSAMKHLLGVLGRWGRTLLHRAPERADWAHLTVYFAGLLELIREGRVRAEQKEPYGEIRVELVEARGGAVEQAEVA